MVTSCYPPPSRKICRCKCSFSGQPAAQLDEAFTNFLTTPANPAYLSPEEIAANREQWIQDWTETILR
jgi:thiamine transport system substrate-binding protein